MLAENSADFRGGESLFAETKPTGVGRLYYPRPRATEKTERGRGLLYPPISAFAPHDRV